MALDRSLRGVKERLCIPFARFLALYLSPTTITVIGFMVGLASCLTLSYRCYAIANVLWWANRVLDGFDGVVARVANKQSDYGGYVDIICDFIIYALLPISFVLAAVDGTAQYGEMGVSSKPTLALDVPGYSDAAAALHLPDFLCSCSIELAYILLAILEATFFVNAASQMFLASILEKRAQGSAAQGEMTTVTLPDGLIEGTETMMLFGAMFFFPSLVPVWFVLFAAGVAINIAYRMVWASIHLESDCTDVVLDRKKRL